MESDKKREVEVQSAFDRRGFVKAGGFFPDGVNGSITTVS